MPNYKQTPITGSQGQRCKAVDISNPYRGKPTITMHEEIVADVGGQSYIKPNNDIHFAFDPAEVIALLDPATSVPTGATTTTTTTGAQVYAAIYSLYIKRAGERDAVVAQADLFSANPPPVVTP